MFKIQWENQEAPACKNPDRGIGSWVALEGPRYGVKVSEAISKHPSVQWELRRALKNP